ncbi:MAG: tRNA (adenosine(37)-N6)-threonylcarbamoyltransferase complex dimerization subunit type 1 TsaB [Bacillales bacterium]|nr:tRNA (adenosine(37)-N6)-threonylcarbamoyltransferase complex dimerization subunit type 1 TsaB [Bacillales bacterium]
MYKLIMDTASDFYYLGIVKDSEVLKEEYALGASNHSETMMPSLSKMLDSLNLKLKDMEEIYTGIGPGSYTGERIAVVIAKMIAIMNKAKLYSFSTLSLIASAKDGEVYSLIDARRGNAYMAHFINTKDSIKRLSEDEVINTEEYFISKEDKKSLIVTSTKPDVIKLLNSDEVKIVSDPSSLSPNYIQLVEAERKRRGLL